MPRKADPKPPTHTGSSWLVDRIVRRLVGKLREMHVIPLDLNPEKVCADMTVALKHAFEVEAIDLLEARLKPGASGPPVIVEREVPTSDAVPFKHMTRALDEIYQLRTLLATEAVRLEEASKLRSNLRAAGRSAEMRESVERMRAAARGEPPVTGMKHEERRAAREKACATDFLNYANWLDEEQERCAS